MDTIQNEKNQQHLLHNFDNFDRSREYIIIVHRFEILKLVYDIRVIRSSGLSENQKDNRLSNLIM
jgi:ABC-type bacteriocin/lantibiotic exporter with double-glycine peptidase domain